MPALRQDLVALEDHLILEILEADPRGGEPPGHPPVARDRSRLVVAIREYRRHPELRGQGRNLLVGPPVPHDDARPAPACTARHPIERHIQLLQAAPDELDAPVAAAGQGVQYLRIEDERTMHAREAAQRVIQRRVIETAQVAAEPDEGGRHPGGKRRKRKDAF